VVNLSVQSRTHVYECIVIIQGFKEYWASFEARRRSTPRREWRESKRRYARYSKAEGFWRDAEAVRNVFVFVENPLRWIFNEP